MESKSVESPNSQSSDIEPILDIGLSKSASQPNPFALDSLVARAKSKLASREAKQTSLLQLEGADLDIESGICREDLYMKLAFHLRLLVQLVGQTHLLRFANLYTERGMCPSSKLALSQSINDSGQLTKLQGQLKPIADLVSRLVDELD